jgi:phage protein D
MSPAATLVSAVEIKVGGQSIDPSLTERLLEARVQDNLMLPDAFLLRFRDPDFQLVDGTLFDVGAKIELKFASTGTSPPGEGFTGEVAAIAPQFESEGCVMVVRGYDVSHKLNRSRNTRTFQDMTASDIAKKVIGEAGLPAEVKATTEVYPFEQQSSETDWSYLWRLAARVSYELACVDGKINFRPPGVGSGAPVKVEWGHDLRAFHPRATAVSQIKKVVVSGWDPKTKRRVESTKETAKLDSSIGLQRNEVSADLGGGTHTIADQIVTTQSEADALAQSTLDRFANSWLEADGVCRGNPKIRAGTKVQVAGVGTRFGGEYLVTRSTHIMRGGTKGYETEFEISGRSRRTLIDLLTPTREDGYTTSLVVGVVTNNDDPEKMGRVRVKFPGLDDQKEGWWARVASTAATGRRGLLMMPLVNDEVVVGFEHGDPRRPFVLGALWNGTNKPMELAATDGKPDGSFNVRSNAKIAVTSLKELKLNTDEAMKIGSKDDMTMKIQQGKLDVTCGGPEVSITCGGSSAVLKQDGSVTIKGSQVTIDASGKLALSSSGVVQIKGSSIMIG